MRRTQARHSVSNSCRLNYCGFRPFALCYPPFGQFPPTTPSIMSDFADPLLSGTKGRCLAGWLRRIYKKFVHTVRHEQIHASRNYSKSASRKQTPQSHRKLYVNTSASILNLSLSQCLLRKVPRSGNWVILLKERGIIFCGGRWRLRRQSMLRTLLHSIILMDLSRERLIILLFVLGSCSPSISWRIWKGSTTSLKGLCIGTR